MTATVVYDKTVYDVNSVGDEGRYQFTLQEDSAAEDGDAASANEDDDDANEEGEDDDADEEGKPAM